MSTPLADGPAMYFGGTIMTFALPLGAFIVISIVLFYLFRSAHSGPRLKYPTTGSFAWLEDQGRRVRNGMRRAALSSLLGVRHFARRRSLGVRHFARRR